MVQKKKNYDNSEEDMPEAEKKKRKEGEATEDRLTAIEDNVDKILKAVSGINKEGEEEEEEKKKQDEEEEEKKKQDAAEEEEEKKKQEEDEEEKKKQDEDEEEMTKEEEEEEKKKKKMEEDEEEKKKEEGEPKPGEQEETLPQAPAGETDETAAPEGDKVNILEKKLGEITKKLNTLLKYGDVIKSRTPRSMHEVSKRKEVRKVELALDMLNKSKKGKLSVADMNRQIKGLVKKNNDEAMKVFFENVRAGRGEV